MFQGIPGRKNDVLEEFPVGQRRHFVVRPEVGCELPHRRRADTARVDPLGLDRHGVGGVVVRLLVLQRDAQCPMML